MPEFLKVKTVDEVFAILQTLDPLEAETVDMGSAWGRVPVADIRAPEAVPHFHRSLMDGYAVRARDTFGASEAQPALLEVAGEVRMGEKTAMSLKPGQCLAIPTGGMLPDGADAVVMVEYTQPIDEGTIEVTRSVAPGDHVLWSGEDIGLGEVLRPAGKPLRPQDLGMLAAMGISRVSVHRKPRVAVISTGDEIVPVESRDVPPGKVRDINSFTLAAQIQLGGGLIGFTGVVEDVLAVLVEVCRKAFLEHDVVVLSGGSSVGMRDLTLQVLEHFPDAELLVHGVAIRPGKPTILARIGPKLFWGLPGQPVSAMMVCRAFVIPSLALLQGNKGDVSETVTWNVVTGILENRLPSVHGRADYVPVSVREKEGQLVVKPIFGKSAMISLLGRADGFIIIPTHVEGLVEGSMVQVYLFS